MIQIATALSLLTATFVARADEGSATATPKSIEAASSKADPVVQIPPEGRLPRALVALSPSSPYALVVDKSQRTLTLWKWNGEHPSLVKAFPTDIGRNDGNKTSEGDRRTPEGVYFFQSVRDKDQLDFSLYGVRAYVTDYPNYFDRLEKKTGTGIWLHAIPDSQTLWRGSKGCVVVRNKVIEELSPYIQLRATPMVVQSRVDYLTPEDWQAEREKLFSWIEKWRTAWEAKDLDKYMEYYDEAFRSNGMNKTKWRAYKTALTEKYSYIKVNLKEVQAFKHQGKFMIRFLQQYESDQKQDFGEKILYIQDSTKGLGIVGEVWQAKAQPSLASSNTGSPEKN